MIQQKYYELTLFLIVFLVSIILSIAFFIMASQNEQVEQTYEMTDHSLKNTEQYEAKPDHSNEESVFAITLSK